MLGKRFGRLTVKSSAGRNKYRQSLWFCLCGCGGSRTVQGYKLTSGETQSCGCLQRERTRTAKITHGNTVNGTVTPEYVCWQNMRSRCLDPKNKAYKYYGERGISVCERWLSSFENFLADMGKRPSEKHSIEREDNEGPYCKENCVWATKDVQNSNQRQNRIVVVDGLSMTVKAAAQRCRIPYTTVLHRLDRGLSTQEALQ